MGRVANPDLQAETLDGGSMKRPWGEAGWKVKSKSIKINNLILSRSKPF